MGGTPVSPAARQQYLQELAFLHSCRAKVRGLRQSAQARRVRQEVLDGDARAVSRVRREERGDVVVYRQPALLGQCEDCRRGELLRQRCQREDVLGLHRHAQFEVCHAVRLAQQHAAVFHDDDGGARFVGRVDGRHDGVDRARHRAGGRGG